MPIFFNLHPCLLSRSIQSRIRLGPAFDRPRFDPAGSIGHPYLRNEYQQNCRIFSSPGEKLPLTPRHPNLQRMLEAQLTRQYVRLQGSLGHEPPNQIVRQQIYPKFFLAHLWRFAAEHFHAQSRFDVSQIQLHIPALPIQLSQLGFGRFARRKNVLTSTFLPTCTSRTLILSG